MILNCPFCLKECKNKNALAQHSLRCKENIDRLIPAEKTEKWKLSIANRRNMNQHIKAKENGLEYEISSETIEKIRFANIGKKHTAETKNKISASIRKAILKNPDSYTSNNVCGRVKIYEYNNEKFHGKWEVQVAIWLDENNIEWIRKVDPINYYWNSSWHLYFPDFYLPKLDAYIEVKGYETDRDKAKWNSLTNLIVIKNKEIQEIKNKSYVLPTT